MTDCSGDSGSNGMDEDLEITARFSRQELVRGWRERTCAPPRVVPVTRLGLKTDLGAVRENNEDKAEFYEPNDAGVLASRGALYVVADGMGGHAAGQIAAELAIKKVLSEYYDGTADSPGQALLDAFEVANEHVRSVARAIPGRSGMGTTLTALALVEDQAVLCHVGDSRAYLIRGDQIRQVSEDHSWVAEQVRAGALTEAEAESSPYRNVITQCIGPLAEIAPDISAVETQPGDRWLLCTDGLTGHVADHELLAVASGQSPSEACRRLVELANSRGGRDNITVMIVDITGLAPWPESS
ncbi:MAG: Stp1/IreP family PP2C-type Ser/Thr phosphatase [Chthonomonadales bacterium]|nr:Stp1/IreP family PP2C-type Ser/Thr phosphatase [Chthonomonadales bacterium]